MAWWKPVSKSKGIVQVAVGWETGIQGLKSVDSTVHVGIATRGRREVWNCCKGIDVSGIRQYEAEVLYIWVNDGWPMLLFRGLIFIPCLSNYVDYLRFVDGLCWSALSNCPPLGHLIRSLSSDHHEQQ